MKRRFYLLLTLVSFGLVSFGLAAEAVPGVPESYQAVTALGVSWLAGWVTLGLTAIAKRWFGTTGPSTVVVSGVLSLATGCGFTLYAAILSNSGTNVWSLVFSTVVAFVGANGAYISQVAAGKKAIKEINTDRLEAL